MAAGAFRTYIKTVADSLNVNGFAENEMVALMRSFDKKGEVMIGILSSMNETLKGVKGDTSRILEKHFDISNILSFSSCSSSEDTPYRR